MLSFMYRFHGHNSLRYVYKNGQAVRSRLITVKYTPNPHRKHSRVAVVISKKVIKSAIGRNRVRRRVYEIMRGELPAIAQPTDIVLLVFSAEVATMPHSELRETIQQLIAPVTAHKR